MYCQSERYYFRCCNALNVLIDCHVSHPAFPVRYCHSHQTPPEFTLPIHCGLPKCHCIKWQRFALLSESFSSSWYHCILHCRPHSYFYWCFFKGWPFYLSLHLTAILPDLVLSCHICLHLNEMSVPPIVTNHRSSKGTIIVHRFKHYILHFMMTLDRLLVL